MKNMNNLTAVSKKAPKTSVVSCVLTFDSFRQGASKPGGGGYSVNFWVGMCRWDSETLTLY